MEDVALLLSILSKRVYTATLPNGASLRDASDFSEWLSNLSSRANEVTTFDELFERRTTIADNDD
jgi:hypothetical protein